MNWLETYTNFPLQIFPWFVFLSVFKQISAFLKNLIFVSFSIDKNNEMTYGSWKHSPKSHCWTVFTCCQPAHPLHCSTACVLAASCPRGHSPHLIPLSDSSALCPASYPIIGRGWIDPWLSQSGSVRVSSGQTTTTNIRLWPQKPSDDFSIQFCRLFILLIIKWGTQKQCYM